MSTTDEFCITIPTRRISLKVEECVSLKMLDRFILGSVDNTGKGLLLFSLFSLFSLDGIGSVDRFSTAGRSDESDDMQI